MCERAFSVFECDLECLRGNESETLPVPVFPLGRLVLVVVFLLGFLFYEIFVGLLEESRASRRRSPVDPSLADVQSSWRSFNYKKLEVPSNIILDATSVTPTTGEVSVNVSSLACLP